MASGRIAYGLLHTHEFLLVQQSTGDLESRTAVLHLVNHWPVEYNSLKALKVWIHRGRTWSLKAVFTVQLFLPIQNRKGKGKRTKSNGHVAAKKTAARHQGKHIQAEHGQTESGVK